MSSQSKAELSTLTLARVSDLGFIDKVYLYKCNFDKRGFFCDPRFLSFLGRFLAGFRSAFLVLRRLRSGKKEYKNDKKFGGVLPLAS